MAISLFNPVEDPVGFLGSSVGDFFNFVSGIMSEDEEKFKKNASQEADEAFGDAIASAFKQQEESENILKGCEKDIEEDSNSNIFDSFFEDFEDNDSDE